MDGALWKLLFCPFWIKERFGPTNLLVRFQGGPHRLDLGPQNIAIQKTPPSENGHAIECQLSSIQGHLSHFERQKFYSGHPPFDSTPNCPLSIPMATGTFSSPPPPPAPRLRRSLAFRGSRSAHFSVCHCFRQPSLSPLSRTLSQIENSGVIACLRAER